MVLTLHEVVTMYNDIVNPAGRDNLGRISVRALSRFRNERYPKGEDSSFLQRNRFGDLKSQIHSDDRTASDLIELNIENRHLLSEPVQLGEAPVPTIMQALTAYLHNQTQAGLNTLRKSLAAARPRVDAHIYGLRKKQFLCWLIEKVEAEQARWTGTITIPGLSPAACNEFAELTCFACLDGATYKDWIAPGSENMVANRCFAATNFLAGGDGVGGGAFVSNAGYTMQQVREGYQRARRERCAVCTTFALAAAQIVINDGFRGSVKIMATRAHVFVVLDHEPFDEDVATLDVMDDGRVIDLWWGSLGNSFYFPAIADIPSTANIWLGAETKFFHPATANPTPPL
ncbi:hypothetical protein [Tropicimonas sp.]|uniref:hypothetical protein n=1 Tax=Tropicimonas sp. TaxID=2067044 RepID=UPI003A87DB87